MSWLDQYLEYAKNNEGLEKFHWWIGAAILGATMKRNVFFSKGYYNVFPPFWLLIVAESGSKKTASLSIGHNIVSKIDAVKILPDKSSPEALARALSRDSDGNDDEAQGLIYAPELANFMDNRSHNAGLVQLLLRLADCPDMWKYETLKGGIVHLKNIAVSFMGATTAELVRDCVPPIALKTGFLARFICISGETSSKMIAFPCKDATEEVKIINSLYEISLLRGEMQIGIKAKEWYVSWYYDHRRIFSEVGSERVRAYLQRKPDYLIRLAMIIAVSETNRLALTVTAFEAALEKLDEVDETLNDIYISIEATTHGREQLSLLSQISRKKEGISHEQLLKDNSKIIADPIGFKKMMSLLYETGQITVFRRNSKIWYKKK